MFNGKYKHFQLSVGFLLPANSLTEKKEAINIRMKDR